MNNNRFTLKLLEVFLMEAVNFSGVELRKTIWAVICGIAFLKLIDLLPLLLHYLAS